jgi:acetylornithine/LysW-gamma-L-lysine aminotransferase
MIDYIALENSFGFNVYPKRDVVIVRGENARVWDIQGREYIDCVAGHGVVNIGHCNPRVVAAIQEQAQKLITCSGIFYNDIRAQLMEKLISIAPKSVKHVFLCNSGAESVEAAIKFARFSSKKTDFICAMRSFHGRTFGALSATFNPEYRKDFEPLVPGFSFVPYNNFEKLQAAITEKTAGIILEIVQGEGGVNPGKREYFEQVSQLCHERNILLIIDEIQTGFCRTGKMFAVEHWGIEPEIMCVAKALAGGLPIGAVLCSEKIAVPTGKHGTTFGGNPLVCAAGVAAINFMLENQLAQQAAEKGQYFRAKLDACQFSAVREIRSLGMMFGLELKEKSKPYIVKLMEEGVLALPAGPTVLRLLPPLTISYPEIDFVVKKLSEVLNLNNS